MNATEKDFTQLVQQQKSTIYTVCLMFSDDPAEVDDLVQETLINLWRGYASFGHRSEVRTWVWRVAMNTCISADRKRKRKVTTGTSIDKLVLSTSEVESEERNNRQIRILHDRIHRLGVFDRAIILLWLENMTYEEIGNIVGITPKNVSVRLARIREQLKNMK